MKNFLIKLLNGYTLDEVDYIMLALKQHYEDRIKQLPIKIRYEYDLCDRDVVLLDGLFYSKIENSDFNTKLPEIGNRKTLICGTTGCGKDFFLKKYISKSRKKTLFFGQKEEYSPKFGYLEDMGFVKYSFDDKISFSDSNIFVYNEVHNLDHPFGHLEQLKELSANALKRGYCIIYNHIAGKNDNYIKTVFEILDENDDGCFVVTSQSLSDYNIVENITIFDELIMMRNVVSFDNEIFKKDNLAYLNRGEYIHFKKTSKEVFEDNFQDIGINNSVTFSDKKEDVT